MKKLLLSLIAASPLILFAQKMKKEKVESSFISYPVINTSSTDASSIKADFCAGELKPMGKSVQKTTNACKPKNGSIKDAKAIEVYYYNIKYLGPVSYLKLSNASGNVIAVERITTADPGQYEFGKDKCYFMESILESAYKKEGEKFEQKSIQAIKNSALDDAKGFVRTALFFSYVPQQIEVHYAKDKDFDYSSQEKAASIAVAGYEAIKNNADDKDAQSKLRQAISMWEKDMEISTPDDRKSKINKKVTLHLAENMATAYLYLREYDKAKEVLGKALELEKNITTNGTTHRRNLLATIDKYSRGYELNKDVPINDASVVIPIDVHPSTEIAQFTTAYNEYTKERMVQDFQNQQDAYEDGVASGEINPYQKYVMETSLGKQLTLPDLGAKLMKEPAGDKLEEFPEEITELTDLNMLILRGNNLKTIPASIAKLKGLKKLNLANNQLTSLPVEAIGELTELKTLILKGNSIKAADIANIQNLLPDCKIKQ